MSQTIPCAGLNCDLTSDLALYSLDGPRPALPQTRACSGTALNCDFPADLDLYSLDGLFFFINGELFFVLECPPTYSCPGFPIHWTTPAGTITIHSTPIAPVTSQIPLKIKCCGNQYVTATVYVTVTPVANSSRINVSIATFAGALDPAFGHRDFGFFTLPPPGAFDPVFLHNVTVQQAQNAILAFVNSVVAKMMLEAAKINAIQCPPQVPPTYPPGNPRNPTPIPNNPPLTFTDMGSTFACANEAFAGTFSMVGNHNPMTFSVSGNVPPGMVLVPVNNNSGAIQGICATPGNYSFTVSVRDDATLATSQKSYSIRVMGITDTSPITSGAACAPYNYSFTAAGDVPPTTWAITGGGLPDGLTMSTAGVISGTPTQGGSFNFTVTISDSSGHSCSKAFTLAITGGNTAQTATCPSNPSITFTIPAGTLVPCGQYAGFDVNQLNAIAFNMAVDGLVNSGLCPLCGFKAENPVNKHDVQMTAKTTGCAINYLVGGFGAPSPFPFPCFTSTPGVPFPSAGPGFDGIWNFVHIIGGIGNPSGPYSIISCPDGTVIASWYLEP